MDGENSIQAKRYTYSTVFLLPVRWEIYIQCFADAIFRQVFCISKLLLVSFSTRPFGVFNVFKSCLATVWKWRRRHFSSKTQQTTARPHSLTGSLENDNTKGVWVFVTD